MSEGIKQHVDPSSPEFSGGVEAAVNSTKDTKNWQAGNELGQELKDEPEKTPPASESPRERPANPLFTRDRLEGSDQDEKDETEE